jgi:hypothetical protein
MFLGRIDHLDRAIVTCADRGHRIDPAVLQSLLAYVEPRGIRLVAAQARRALGLAIGGPAELRRALGKFEAMGAISYAARVQVELGELTGERGIIDAGTGVSSRWATWISSPASRYAAADSLQFGIRRDARRRWPPLILAGYP